MQTECFLYGKTKFLNDTSHQNPNTVRRIFKVLTTVNESQSTDVSEGN